MKRKEILPKWIRFFAWIYLFGFLSPLFLLILLFGGKVKLVMFGLEYVGTSLQPIAIIISIIAILAAFVAYGILWGKDWAIRLGTIYGYIAIATCIASFFIKRQTGGIHIAFEPLILIPFIITLKKNRLDWDNFDPDNENKEQIPQIDIENTAN